MSNPGLPETRKWPVQEPSWKNIRGASSWREGWRRKGEVKDRQPGKLVDFQGLPPSN